MEFINQIAEQWLQPLAVHIFEFSLFIFLIWLIDQTFRLSTKVRYGLWLLALLKMFIPPILQLPQQTEMVRQSVYVLEPISAVVANMEPAFSLSIYSWIAIIWLISIVLCAVIFCIKNRQLRRLLSTARAIDTTKLEITQLNTINNLRLFASDHLQTPLLTGVLRPALYLPASFVNWPHEQLESVLQHEIAHVQQRDLWVLALQTLALVLFGLNPLVWFTHRRLLHVRELRCDEIAIGKTGIHPTDYSRFLYDILQTQQQPQVALVNAINFAEDSQAIFKRFSHIFEISKKGVQKMRWWHYLVVAGVCLAILPLSWQCSNKKIMSPEAVNQAESGKFFVEFDKAPAPVGGFAAIQNNLKYPEIARKAGIEGRVILNVLVEADGSVTDAKVLKNLGEGHNGCAESAIAAVKAVAWEPAEKDGKPVSVWIGIPVIFRLKNESTVTGEGVGMKVADDGKQIYLSKPKSKKFVKFDQPPKPIGGFAAIQANLKYPALARAAGIQGRVIVHVRVGTDGKVLETKILKDLGEGDNGCAEAAAAAVKMTKWQPAEYEGKPVEVWVGIPVIFKLK